MSFDRTPTSPDVSRAAARRPVEQLRLANGTRVVLQQQHTAPVVAIEVWVGVGAADERPHESGLAHVHEHMLFKGTARRGVGEIAREIEAAGGEINAMTSLDYTVYYAQLSSRFFETGLEVLADAVQSPRFDAGELARELEVIDEEIKRAEDSPAHLAHRLLFATAYATHAYGRPVLGEREVVLGFEREDVQRFFARWYVPSNMTVVVVGDFEAGAARGLLATHFGQRPAAAAPGRARAREPEQEALRVAVARAETREHHLQVGFRGPAFGPDTIEVVAALDVLAIALGGSESARLDVTLRRRRRLVSAVSASAYTPRDPGLFLLSALYQGGRERTREVVEALLGVALEARYRPLRLDELERARVSLTSQEVYRKQTVLGQARKLGFYGGLMGDLELEARYQQAVEALTIDDVRRAASEHLRPERATIALVTPDEAAAAVEPEALRAWALGAFAGAERQAAARLPEADRHGVHHLRLSSGLELLIQPDASTPLLSFWCAAPGGKRHDPAAQPGLGNLLGEMLTRGTSRRDADGISAAMEEIGGHLSGYAGNNSIGVCGACLSRDAERGLALFAECLQAASLPEDELERERQLLLEDIQAQDDDLPGLAFRQLSSTLYGAHPYGRPLIGTAESVPGLTREALRAHQASLLQPRRMVVALVGDITPRSAVDLVERCFEAHASGGDVAAPDEPSPPMPRVSARPQLLTRQEPRQQAHLALGFLGVRFDDPERHALDLIAALLAGQSGRLFLELRDRQSLAYSVTAFNRPDLDPGYFAFYTATSPDKIDAALRGIGAEVRRLQREPVDAAELERAQRYVIGSHDIALQRASARASLMALHHLYGLGHGYHHEESARVMAVTPAELLEAARRHLDLERVILSAVHPPESEVRLAPLLDP